MNTDIDGAIRLLGGVIRDGLANEPVYQNDPCFTLLCRAGGLDPDALWGQWCRVQGRYAAPRQPREKCQRSRSAAAMQRGPRIRAMREAKS
mgnify:CR=1 FL=1